MAIANGHGVFANREHDMEALAKLPRIVRDFINDAPEAFSAEEFRMMQRRQGLDANELLEHVRDLVHAYQTQQTRRTYGPDHPQLDGDSYDKWTCKRNPDANTRLRYLRDRRHG